VTVEEKRVRRLEVLVSGLLSKLYWTLDVTHHEEPCHPCDGKGSWQDGGACPHCEGAGVKITFKGGMTP
jgi:DnaJ-class molecular chaperone